MVCAFCTKHVESADDAIEADWCPAFYGGEDEYEGPVCPECASRHLVRDNEGEMSLKPGTLVPVLAIPLRFRHND